MTNATSTSNPSFIVEVGEVYPYPSHFIAPNFVTTKLSGKDTYDVWETQILCLLKSHHMFGFVEGEFPSPAGNGKGKVEDIKAWIASDSLVKGWILGSLSDGVAKKVVNRLKPKRMVDMEAWVASDSLVKDWILGSIPEDAEAVNTVVNHLTHKENNTDFSSKDLWDELQYSYGPSAASTSNPSIIVDVGEAYPYPSLIAANFVTVKLSGKNKYNLWETQMLCLLKSHQMYGFIDGQFPRPAGNGKGKAGDLEAWIISDWLVKGWILGSLSEEAARKAVNHLKHKKNNTDFTAKDLWDELQRSYGPSVREQAAETKVTTRQAESLIEDAKSKDEPTGLYEDYKKRRLYKSVLEGDTYWTAIDASPISEDAKSKDEPTEEKTKKEKFDEIRDKYFHKRWLYETILEGETDFIKFSLDILGLKPWDKLANNGNTVLHVAVASSTKNHLELLKELLKMTPTENTLLDLVNSNGSTLLHVAAIGDNIKAVNLLVERNPALLLAKDKENHTPLALSVSNMHTKTSHCLFEHIKEEGYGSYFSGKSGEEIVVLAISCQDFRLANMIIKDYSDAILPDSDAVLTALAQNFPRELNFWERGWKEDYYRIIAPYSSTAERLWNYLDSSRGCQPLKIFIYFFIVLCLVATMFYGFLKMFVRLFLEDTFHIHEDATNLLSNVCEKIRTKYKSSTYPQYYTTSTFEATRRNTSTFIRCIMKHFSDAIWGTNEDGHNFIQYSVINRSEKIYNLLYEMSEHKNIYKTIKDSSENNLLHLAARLAPTNKLNLISGAALQIQRELQWYKEVERFVCPLSRIQKNSDDETPEMVFIREHKDLVNEGEKWIKKTAESYTITAALIITIVFAAAITVPGGNNQESGIPIFTNDITFTVFAISDAISLFTAVTSLLMFLSILTARFSEQDFLFKLPTKLIIGLAMLFLSTTAMIIAFGATLFLVFGQGNSPMLIPIGALTCLPVTSFVTLQFPLIVDLIRATYCGGFFVRERYEYFY